MYINKKILLFAGIPALLAALTWYSDLYIGTVLANYLRYYSVPLLVFAVFATAMGLYPRLVKVGPAWPMFALGATAVVAPFVVGFYGAYLADQAYAESVEITEDPVPTFEERTAWEIARNRVASDKGDLIGSAVSPRYLPDQEFFGSLVEGTGFTAGYSGVVQQTIAADGRTEVATCEFGDGTGRDGYRLGGNFDGSLTREISHIDRGLIVSDSDAYGYCDGGTAVTVVPLTRLEGWFPAIEVPAGVAVYADGRVTIDREVEAGEYPGPVYATSLAARQRSSLKVLDSNLWTWVRGKAGYTEATTDGDPNSENPTEFSLDTAEGPVYVTPMTRNPKQDQATISAYTVIASDEVVAGVQNTMQLHTVPSEERRESNGVVVDNLKSFYSEADYGWAQGLKVFEMVPVSGEEWVASLGFEKSVKFRVRLAADGSSCLEDAAGNVLRCVDETGQVVGGTSSEEAGEEGSTVGVPNGGISKLSDRELADLQQQITEEMLRRIESNQQG